MSERKLKCKKCKKTFDDTDKGLYETTKERYCYKCAMENMSKIGDDLDRTGRDLDTLLKKYG